jgi:hypothetical protein
MLASQTKGELMARRPGNRTSAADSTTGESRWTRFLLSIMGPPQLGDVRSPVRASAPDLDVCPRCGHLQVEHATVRTARATFLRCPDGSELTA